MVTPSLYTGKDFPAFEMDIYRNLSSVDFPRTTDGDLAGMVHPQLQVGVVGARGTLNIQLSPQYLRIPSWTRSWSSPHLHLELRPEPGIWSS